MSPLRRPLSVLVLPLLLLGCPSVRQDDDDVADDDAGDDDTAAVEGIFRIGLVESGDFAYAYVSNPVIPSPWWIPELDIGDCVFHRAVLGLCDPPCTPPEVCDAHGECVSYPEPISAGDIAVEGLAVDLVLEVGGPYLYYTAVFDPEPADGALFAEGDAIEATAPGDALPTFAVQTQGVAPMETGLPCPLEYEGGQPLTVSWTPAPQGDRVHLELRSGNHGSQFAAVVCETADDGELVVDAEIVDAYLAEWRPVELWQLTRYHEGTVVAGETLVQLWAVTSASCMW